MGPTNRPLRETPRFVVGTMTGTSIDGDLDAALIEIRGEALDMNAKIVATGSWPLGAVAADLRRIAAQEPLTAGEFARIARAFGEIHADAIALLCEGAGVQPDLVVLHGQTVFHAPPLTWQLLDPWPVALRMKCRVRYDLRSANLVSGGQGAPITPIADYILFASNRDPKVVMNLDGFINVTLLPTRGQDISAIRGFDVCACNHLLDRVARTRLGSAFDRDGEAATRGNSDVAIAQRIAQAIAQAIAPTHAPGAARRSLGTGDEAARLVELTAALSPQDACSTIVEAIADATIRTLRAELSAPGTLQNMASSHEPSTPIPHTLLAGGSARNRALHAALARRSGAIVQTTDEWNGVPVGMREAVEMAILGALADDGVRYSLARVTGVASLIPESAVLEAPILAERTQV